MKPLILKPYQWRMAMIAIVNDACALWAEMGLGKTASALYALLTLLATGESKRVLVIAPKRVAEHTWPSELDKWDAFRSIRYRVLTVTTRVTGKSKTGKQIRDFVHTPEHDSDEPMHIVGRENIAYLARHYGQDWPYDTVILDEACGFKSHASLRYKAIRMVRPKIRRIIELTGTPGDEGYLDLWSQLYLLDLGERLGRTITSYRETYFNSQRDYYGTTYTIRDGAAEQINTRVSDICVSLRTEDYLTLPDRLDQTIEVQLTDEQLKTYRRMARHYTAEIDNETVTADTTAALTSKLLQLANGTIYQSVYDDEKEVRHTRFFHGAKLDALQQLIEQADSPVLVAYSFLSDKERILDRFGSAQMLDSPAAIDEWNAGRIQTALIHPANAAGLNLQDGGHILAWFGLPWALRMYRQTCARLHRQGQTKPVLNYHIVSAKTRDLDVLAALQEKRSVSDALMAAVKLQEIDA